MEERRNETFSGSGAWQAQTRNIKYTVPEAHVRISAWLASLTIQDEVFLLRRYD